MKIIEERYNWSGSLSKRGATKYIILHHRAGNGDAQSIHKTHLANGWSGIGYHFYVRKNGEIYRGRPIETVGAHCTGYNSNSIGVCFEGNYETECQMPDAQLESGRELIEKIKGIYSWVEVKRHCDLGTTACPGKNFPFSMLNKKALLTSAEDITDALAKIIEINDKNGFVAALNDAKFQNTPLYWGFYKIVNN